jgi:hypothetical protein
MTTPSRIKMEPPTYVQSERHPNLYYADGDVVLSAPLPGGGRRVFRVHVALLSLNSTVLAEMLAQPAPDGVEPELYDNVRMINVAENGLHWGILLHILYRG